MKIGQTVWIPSLRVYGRIHEINWDKNRIQSVEVIDPVTSIPKIINVLGLIVEAVGLIERLIMEIANLFRSKDKKR